MFIYIYSSVVSLYIQRVKYDILAFDVRRDSCKIVGDCTCAFFHATVDGLWIDIGGRGAFPGT